MHTHTCYPLAIYAPYWTIFVGFITSTIIQLYTFISGHSIIGFFRSWLCCKCCRNIKYDMTERDEWTEFPNVINIAPENPFSYKTQLQQQISVYLGDYKIEHDHTSNVFYKSNFLSVPNEKHYVLKYMNIYKCWVLIAEEEDHFKYEMIQVNDIITTEENEQKTVEMSTLKVNEDIHKYETIRRDDKIIAIEATPLNLLDLKFQKFKVFPSKKIEVDSSVSMSEFLYDQMINIKSPPFMLNRHWITFRGLKYYKHNVSDDTVLNINGSYRLTSVQSDPPGFRQTISYKFTHSHSTMLHATYTLFLLSMSSNVFVEQIWILIKHDNWGHLAQYDFDAKKMDNGLIQFSDENLQKMHDTFVCQQYQFSEAIEVVLRIQSSTSCKRYIGLVILIILMLMIIYQFVIDGTAFVEYSRNVTNYWYKYECFAYIISNSPNMKQFCIFVLCSMLLGDSFANRKYYSITGKYFKNLGKLYAILYIPVFLTHSMPWILAYSWLWITVCCFYYCIKRNYFVTEQTKSDEAHHERREPYIQNWMKFVCIGFIFYFFIILIPVSTMSRLYTGGWDEYWYSFYSVFTDRNTSDYFNLYQKRWVKVQQTIMWIF
eukprot:102751_1